MTHGVLARKARRKASSCRLWIIQRSNSHEVLAVEIDGREVILDPMSNQCLPHGFRELLAKPELARPPREPDARWRERQYDLYSTAEWYRRVVRYAIRTDPGNPPRWIRTQVS